MSIQKMHEHPGCRLSLGSAFGQVALFLVVSAHDAAIYERYLVCQLLPRLLDAYRVRLVKTLLGLDDTVAMPARYAL